MRTRFEGVVGEDIELLQEFRTTAGVYYNPNSLGDVLIYPYHPIDQWSQNVLVSSTMGNISSSEEMNRLIDLTVNFITSNVAPGNYIEITSPSAVAGRYKIETVSPNSIYIEGTFPALSTNIEYEITRLKAILTPSIVSTGIYKVIWSIPDSEAGGSYYDYWTNIHDAPGDAAYYLIDKLYASKVYPFWSGGTADVTDRYYARQGTTAILDFVPVSYPSHSPIFITGIDEVRIYRSDPSGGMEGPVMTSSSGYMDTSDFYLFHDDSVDFSSLKRYDTLRITSGADNGLDYYIAEVVDAHTIRTIEAFDTVESGVSYEIYAAYILRNEPVKTSEYGYSIEFWVEPDFEIGTYYDLWIYHPTESTTEYYINTVSVHKPVFDSGPTDAGICNIIGRVIDIGRQPVTDLEVIFYVTGPEIYRSELLAPMSIRTRTDGAGFFNLGVAQGTTGIISIPEWGWSSIVNVPLATVYNIGELNLS